MTDPNENPARLSIFILAGALWALSAWFFPFFPALGSPNELSRLYVTRAIVDDGSLAVDGPVARFGRITDLAQVGGRLYSDKAPGISFAGVPIYAILLAAHGLDPGAVSNESLLRWLRIFLSGLPTAGIVILLWSLLGRLRLDVRQRFFLAAAYGLGTIAFPYGTLLFGHQLAALCLFGGFFVAEQQSRSPTTFKPILTGFLLGSALLVEYTTVLLVVPLAVYSVLVSSHRARDACLGFAGSLVPLAALASYQIVAFGNPFSTGYAHLATPAFAEIHNRGLLGLNVPSLGRLATILFSPNKGLWFFSPWLVLAIPGLVWGILWPLSPRWRPAWIAFAAGTLLYLLFSASLDLAAWGWSLGPRHLAPLIPFMVLSVGILVNSHPPWPKWIRRALLILVPTAVVLTILPSATFGGFPPDFSNPVADCSLPLLLSGCLPQSFGTSLGLGSFLGAVPFFVGLLALLVWMTRSFETSLREKLICLAVALALSGAVLASTGPPNPSEDRALAWVQHDILGCPRQ